MTEVELLDGIKQIVINHYTVLKEAYDELKHEIDNINMEISIYNRFIGMIKKPKDFHKKNVTNYYENFVMPLLMDAMDDFVDDIDEEDYLIEAQKLDWSTTSEDSWINQRLDLTKKRTIMLEEKKSSMGDINVYTNQIGRIKRILKSLNSNMFYEDDESFNNIIEYIDASDIIENTKSDLLKCIQNKRNNFLEKQESLRKERELKNLILENKRKEKIRIEKESKSKVINTNSYKFNYTDILSIDDINLINEINKEIYDNDYLLYNISQEIFDVLNDILNLDNLDFDINSILPNCKINNYKNISILFEAKKILNEINKIFEIIKINKLDNNNISKYKIEINYYLEELKTVYLGYIPNDDIIDISPETSENKKHIIYLKNSSDEILLKNDIKKDPNIYMSFIKMLEDLKKGYITNNCTKDAKYINNDLICKKKHHQSRLVYYPYKDYYIVFLGFVKKSNNNMYEANLVFDRFSNYKNKIDNVICDLNNPDLLESIIEENDNIHDELINYLKTNSRSKKKELKK